MTEETEFQRALRGTNSSRGATVRLGKYHGTLGQPSMRMDDRDLAFAAWHIFTTHNRGQIDQILLSCDDGIRVHLERLVARHGRRRRTRPNGWLRSPTS